jgi:ribosome modulation factor
MTAAPMDFWALFTPGCASLTRGYQKGLPYGQQQKMCPNRSHEKEGWMRRWRITPRSADGVVNHNKKIEPINP